MRAVGKDDQGQLFAIDAAALDQLTGGLVRFGVQQLVGDGISRQKIPDLVEVRRPTMADDADAFKRRTERGLPIVEQVIDDPVETFFGRVPWFHQVMIDLYGVD